MENRFVQAETEIASVEDRLIPFMGTAAPMCAIP